MINVNEGKVNMKGTLAELSSDISVALSAYKDMIEKELPGGLSEKLFNKTVELATKSDEELKKRSRRYKNETCCKNV